MEALAVRPYGGDRIRKWIYVLLEEQGVAIKTTPDLADGIPESNIVHSLRAMRADLLLLPFLTSRTGGGRPTDGWAFLDRIRREVPWARRTPAILHVGIFALSAFTAAYGGRDGDNLFLLYEDELAAAATPRKIADFLQVHSALFRRVGWAA